MARPSSIALGGYFPAPFTLLPSLASLVSFARQDDAHILVDPCAGDGFAIDELRKHWFERADLDARIYAVELEKERAKGLRVRLSQADRTFHCDAFQVEISGQDGASLLFLNPPYDSDKVHGRLEQRFLERWSASLIPGEGVLLFLVPFYALRASAEFLAQHYQDIRAWRFPQPSFTASPPLQFPPSRRSHG